MIKFLKHIKKEVNYVQFLIKNGIITQTLGRVKKYCKTSKLFIIMTKLK